MGDWCDMHYFSPPTKNDNHCNDDSLISSWWKRLTANNEFAVSDYSKLKPTQKKWSKYLNDLVELKFEAKTQKNNEIKWYQSNNKNIKKKIKTKQDIKLFKAFINAHIHFVESVAPKNDENDDEFKRIQRKKGAIQ